MKTNDIKIYFDNQIFTIQKFGGISRYFTNLFDQFDKLTYKYKIIGFLSKNIYLSNRANFKLISISFLNFKGSHIIIHQLNSLIFFMLTYFGSKKIIHHTYYKPFYLYRKKDFHIITVYDMIHEIFKYDEEFSQQKRKCIEKADLIISISNSTTQDLINIFNISPSKIKTVYLSSSISINNTELIAPFEHNYILYVGLRDRYKNFDALISAISLILIQNPNTYLLCAGGPDFNLSEKKLLEKLKITDKVKKINFYSDSELANLYHFAMFFVFPSKYEGFGIPILEAMNCHCPVVLSRSSSMVEIAAEAGHYFDPESIDSIYKSCKEIHDSEGLRQELIEKGKLRAKLFSSEITAKNTIDIYNSISF